MFCDILHINLIN